MKKKSKPLRFAGLMCAALLAALSFADSITNTVVTVDQHGALNVEGVASVEDVATNAVKVQIAEAKADAARRTATDVANALHGVAANITSNNTVIYRSGFSDGFSTLVNIMDSDVLAIAEARWVEKSAARIVVEIDYVSTVNLGTTKPAVFHHNTCTSKEDFAELAESAVTTPVYHSGSVEIDGQTFSGYYTTTATIPNPAGTDSYFLWIQASGDTPDGDGTTLDLPNGVTGGVTEQVTWGDKVLTFRGGILTEVNDL